MRAGLIVKFFFRKSKKSFAVIMLFILMFSLLLNMGLMLVTDYKDNFFRVADRLNSEDIVVNFNVLSENGQKKAIKKLLKSRDDISDFTVYDCVTVSGSCEYGDGSVNNNFTFLSTDSLTESDVGKYEILSSDNMNGVYLPYIFKANHFYDIGDEFSVTLDGTVLTWNVKGFYNAVATGSVNCRNFTLLLSPKDYDAVKEQLDTSSLCVSIRLKDNSEIEKREAELISDINGCTKGMNLIYGTNIQKLSANRFTAETICEGIILGATGIAVVVLLAAIVVTLTDIVRRNIRNLGTFKALGYVSRSIELPVIGSFFFVSVIFSLLGIAASYLLFPKLNALLETQVGVPYTVTFMPLPAIISFVAALAVVNLTVVFSIRRIKTIQPIMAIRDSARANKGSKLFPLHKTKLPLNLALALKSTFGGFRNSAVILVSALLVTLLLGFDCFCYQYIVDDPSNLIRCVFGNLSESTVVVTPDQEDDFKSFASNDERVTGFYLYCNSDICHEGGYRLTANIVDKKISKYDGDVCISGSFPKTGSEVAVNCYYADKFDLSIGDEMLLSAGGKQVRFTVCGTFQDVSCSGRSIMLHRDGAEKLMKQPLLSYSVLLKDGVSVDEFNRDAEDSGSCIRAVNNKESIDALSRSYTAMLTAISIFIFILSVAIIVLILYIIISIMVDNRKREFGIYKAIGFATKQIIFQNAVGIMPAVIIAVSIGMALSKRGISVFMGRILKNIGFASFGGAIGTPILLVCGGFLLLLTFTTACLISGRIRGIVPHDLFNNE